jgi:hypothetical protein
MTITSEKRVWRYPEIRELLETSDTLLLRGIVRIYQLQTADEQQMHGTTHHNGVGFNSRDAKFLSDIAKRIISFFEGQSQYDTPLSTKQKNAARRSMVKYAKQLTRIANGELTVPPLPWEKPKFRIDWDNGTHISYSQEAWSDVTVDRFNYEGEYDSALCGRELNEKRPRYFGACGSCDVVEVDESTNTVVIRRSCPIGD